VVFRHLLSVATLPFVVTVLIPLWLTRRQGRARIIEASATYWWLQLVGVVCLIVGVLLFASSLRRFATEGRGTLAPWDPPRRLVLHGPYRYVRNPMISGVVSILFGEALLMMSQPILTWAITFLTINLVFIPLFEEPQLRERFGASYIEYCRHVPRFIPRLRPWHAS
jgi:protein-S-isoprenylcysteine O-methyltransferase Ste14